MSQTFCKIFALAIFEFEDKTACHTLIFCHTKGTGKIVGSFFAIFANGVKTPDCVTADNAGMSDKFDFVKTLLAQTKIVIFDNFGTTIQTFKIVGKQFTDKSSL